MDSSMQHPELLVSDILASGAARHPDSRVHEYRDGVFTSRTFLEIESEAKRLAAALSAIGVQRDDIIATLCWNTTEHLVSYFAVPSIGAVLHTINLRLHDEQLIYIVNHARDRVILISADLVPLLEHVIIHMPTLKHIIVVGPASMNAPAGVEIHDYRELVESASPDVEWPTVPEKSAAILCYTSGTTGNPKGVAYSHRSIYLHTLMLCTAEAFGFTDSDCVFPVVPMFHANAWGWPHAAWLAGSDIVMNGRHLGVEHLARIITELKPTVCAAVPTLWTALDQYGLQHDVSYASLRLAVVGGSALSPALATSMLEHHDVKLTQGWGMTESSPLLTLSVPPADTDSRDWINWATMSGRLMPVVKARIVDESGSELPWDGVSIGEVELAGPTIAGQYFRVDHNEMPSDSKFRGGWLRSGDAAVIHRGGWVEIRDRLKDGIKSGGEWVSSIELENLLLEHPAISEAVVVGVPDAKWEERPLACVVLRRGHASTTADDLRTYLAPKLAKWAIPERWEFLNEIPKTSLGKIDKRRVRADYG
jgi:fatty-acyl-CoA synthase